MNKIHRVRISSTAGQSEIELLEGKNIVGRDAKCRVRIDDAKASREHCQLKISDNEAKVIDLDSRNGILVNGKKVTEARLQSGDRILIGVTALVYEVIEKSDTQNQGISPSGDIGKGVSVTEPAGRPKPEDLLSDLPSDTPKIAGFEMLSKIAEGGMGVVYKARQTSLGRVVAIKFIRKDLCADPTYIERFSREAKILAQLQQANIVQVIDFGNVDGRYYLIMEFVDGESLAGKIRKQGALPEEQCASIAVDIARALARANENGLVHRDIKPENILIAHDGTAKLCDLGIAKSGTAQESLTSPGQYLGSALYVAPEQAQGKPIDIRTDLYSLGATIFCASTGRPPYEGDPLSVVAQHIHAPVPDPKKVNPKLSPNFSQMIRRLMEKDPNKRYKDPAALISELGRNKTNVPAKGTRRAEAESPKKKSFLSRNAVPLGICGVVLLCTAGVLLFLILMQKKERGEKPAAESVLQREVLNVLESKGFVAAYESLAAAQSRISAESFEALQATIHAKAIESWTRQEQDIDHHIKAHRYKEAEAITGTFLEIAAKIKSQELFDHAQKKLGWIRKRDVGYKSATQKFDAEKHRAQQLLTELAASNDPGFASQVHQGLIIESPELGDSEFGKSAEWNSLRKDFQSKIDSWILARWNPIALAVRKKADSGDFREAWKLLQDVDSRLLYFSEQYPTCAHLEHERLREHVESLTQQRRDKDNERLDSFLAENKMSQVWQVTDELEAYLPDEEVRKVRIGILDKRIEALSGAIRSYKGLETAQKELESVLLKYAGDPVLRSKVAAAHNSFEKAYEEALDAADRQLWSLLERVREKTAEAGGQRDFRALRTALKDIVAPQADPLILPILEIKAISCSDLEPLLTKEFSSRKELEDALAKVERVYDRLKGQQLGDAFDRAVLELRAALLAEKYILIAAKALESAGSEKLSKLSNQIIRNASRLVRVDFNVKTLMATVVAEVNGFETGEIKLLFGPGKIGKLTADDISILAGTDSEELKLGSGLLRWLEGDRVKSQVELKKFSTPWIASFLGSGDEALSNELVAARQLAKAGEHSRALQTVYAVLARTNSPTLAQKAYAIIHETRASAWLVLSRKISIYNQFRANKMAEKILELAKELRKDPYAGILDPFIARIESGSEISTGDPIKDWGLKPLVEPRCKSCRGYKEVMCTGCTGAGSSSCWSCAGKGSTPCSDCPIEACDTCRGGGRAPGRCITGCTKQKDGTFGRWCSTCSGSGERASSVSPGQTFKCDSCDGKGYAPCSKCGGNGEIDKVCPACKGRGKAKCKTCSNNGSVSCKGCSGSGNSKCDSCKGTRLVQCADCVGGMPAADAAPRSEPGVRSHDPVMMALCWLARHQEENGSWTPSKCVDRCGGIPGTQGVCFPSPGADSFAIGTTSLSILAFVQAGHTTKSDVKNSGITFGSVVSKARDFLIKNQNNMGRIGPDDAPKQMYNHILATWALCELHAASNDAASRTAALKAVEFLIKARNRNGAWRYTPGSGDSDSSVSAMAFLALHAAKRAGIEVPAEVAGAALTWFDHCMEKELHRVGYIDARIGKVVIPGVNEHFSDHPSLTAAANYCRILGGSKTSDKVKKGVELVMSDLPEWDARGLKVDFYYWHYGTRLMAAYDGPSGPQFKKWTEHTRRALYRTQNLTTSECRFGSWEPVDRWSNEGGRAYVTALGALILSQATIK